MAARRSIPSPPRGPEAEGRWNRPALGIAPYPSHPVHLSPVDPGVKRVQRIMLATSGPESIGEAQEVCLVDCLQDEHDCLLDDLVLQAEDAQWRDLKAPTLSPDLTPPIRNRWFADSPLERAGFEPSVPNGSRSECESDQPECDGHVCDGFVVPCRDRGRVCRGWASTDPNLNLSPAPSQRYVQVIDIMHTHLGAGAAMAQPFFFCASDHSIEPGWGRD